MSVTSLDLMESSRACTGRVRSEPGKLSKQAAYQEEKRYEVDVVVEV